MAGFRTFLQKYFSLAYENDGVPPFVFGSAKILAYGGDSYRTRHTLVLSCS